MFTIEDKFVNSKQKVYDNIRNIHFDEIREMSKIVTYVTETSCEGFDTSYRLNNGIYLFKTNYDYTKALRIYKDYADYKYLCYRDEKLVSKLQNKQKYVKLTEFPTGVVTIGNKVIGQEIPYYENHITLSEAFNKKLYKKVPTYYYIEILKIIKELYSAGITYTDIHAKNLLMSMRDETVKLIDFEDHLVRIDECSKCDYELMVDYLTSLIMKLNVLSNIDFKGNFSKTKTFEEIEESLLENHERLIK